MKDMLLSNGGWALRIVTVTVFLIVIALSLFPRVVSHISTSAIVNAPVLVIRSPVEGHMEGYEFAAGSFVSQGQDIAVFREAGTDEIQKTNLEARLSIVDAAVTAVEERIRDVEDIQRSLEARHRLYRNWHTAILEREVEELEAQLRGALARAFALEKAATRVSELNARQMVSDSDLLEASTQLIEQNERVAEIEAVLGARRLMLSAMRDDTLAGTTGTNTAYTRQRQDEVRLELARLHDELMDHTAERDALQAQLADVLAIFARDNRVTLSSPIQGIVWRSGAFNGRPVLPGDEIVEILDCHARYLEAFLPERLMGTIAVGDVANVQLTGDTEAFSAPIVSILGNGALFDHSEHAAKDTSPKGGKMRVIIALPAEILPMDRGNFCHVGRTAQISLPRDLSSLSRYATLFSQSLKRAVTWFEAAASDIQRS